MNVVLLIYRRPELTRRVFEAIREARPARLLVVADGPRSDEERVRCEATRAIIDGVDWPCEVLRNYADKNMGCRERVASGLNWVFSQVEEAMILEDDCVPVHDFFPFCAELLSRYRSDERVMQISGSCFPRIRSRASDYYFSRYPHVWGWATWRRAWQMHQADMRDWPERRDSGWLRDFAHTERERAYWLRMLNDTYEQRIDTWDFAWFYTIFKNNGLSINPRVNLVSNLGFGPDATHTVQERPWFPRQREGRLLFPLTPPAAVLANEAADRWTYCHVFDYRIPRWRRALRQLVNPYFYGRLIRALPVVGAWWTAWRAAVKRRQEVTGDR